MLIGEELHKRLIKEGINPSDVEKVTTINDKLKRLIITKIILSDNSEHKLIDDYVFYASRKNKQW